MRGSRLCGGRLCGERLCGGRLGLLAWLALALPSFAAAQSYSVDLLRAIEVAIQHPIFASGLVNHPGWSASGYHAQDRYGLWRVDFAAADGERLGWAQVQLDAERVVAWEADFGLDGEVYEKAEEALFEFLRYDSQFLALGGDVDDHEWAWVDYEDWRDTWIVYLERGADSLAVIVRSDHAWTRSLEDLQIVQIQVPALVAVDEWRSRRGADAILLAFTDSRVAAAVRGLEGWTTEVDELDQALWRVRFQWQGRTVVEAEVDLDEGMVLAVR